MFHDWRHGLMAAFIAAVIIACLFGPYVISIVLGGLGLLCYLSAGHRSPEA
jgi:hypothetical protein